MELRDLLDKGDLFHIWGEGGTGKTLLACALAGEAVKDGRVEWICANGKQSFVRTLRANVRALDGHNVLVSFPSGYWDVQRTVENLVEYLHTDTILVVVDPITRVLDMSRQEALMWGQELIEETLPLLVALTHEDVKVILVSEVRCLEDTNVPVMHGSISVWKPVDLHVLRGPGRDSTIIERSGGGQERQLARMSMDSSGVVRLTTPIEVGRQDSCSESHSTA